MIDVRFVSIKLDVKVAGEKENQITDMFEQNEFDTSNDFTFK
jgi:hypothetical protein